MRKNILTIAKKTFSTGTSWKTPVSRLTLIASLLFILSILFFSASIAADLFMPHYYNLEDTTIVVVNTPDSFDRFVTESNTMNIHTFVHADSYGAYYDYGYFNRLMEENNAFMALVFSEEFDQLAYDNNKPQMPQLMTYFNIQDPYALEMHEDALERIELEYTRFLLRERGVPSLEHKVFFNTINYSHLSQDTGSGAYFFLSRMLIPLLMFIFILFVSMESGVAAIAGEKEKGTFARLLLTPITRIQIVSGHVLGIFLRTIIVPILLLMAMLLLTELSFLYSLAVLGVILSLSLIISTLIIMISVMGKNTVSAQTAFLPIFLILLMVCVVSMQTQNEPSYIYYILPFFGHFNTIVSSLTGSFSLQPYLMLTLISILSSAVMLVITERLMRVERFTVLSDGESGRKMVKTRKMMKKEKAIFSMGEARSIFNYRIKRIKNPVSTILYHFWFPLAALSAFQFLSLILPIRAYLKLDASSDFFKSIASMIEQYRVDDLSDAAYDLMSLLMQQPSFLVSMSFGYVGMILLYMFVVKILEKNSLATLGFPFKTKSERKAAFVGYGKGLVIGMSMIMGIYAFQFLFGQIKPVGFQLTPSGLGLLFAYIIMWIPQGAAEEVMMRGYMMPRIAARFGRPAGVFLSSLLFSLLHAGNPGFNILAFINLIIISFFFALLALRTQEIYTVCAAHTAWNFTQGNLLGMTVSGSTGAATLLETQYTDKATDLLTGGGFGPEGGLAVTIVTMIGLAVLFLTRKRHQNKAANNKTIS